MPFTDCQKLGERRQIAVHGKNPFGQDHGPEAALATLRTWQARQHGVEGFRIIVPERAPAGAREHRRIHEARVREAVKEDGRTPLPGVHERTHKPQVRRVPRREHQRILRPLEARQRNLELAVQA